jgi:uncharacterized OB-fold protein
MMSDTIHPVETERPYWQTQDGSRLLASEEIATGERFFPPLPSSSPLSARYRDMPMGTEATVYSFTVIHPHPKSGKAPFALIYADLPEAVRVFGVYEGGRPAIGERVRAVTGSNDDGFARYTFQAVSRGAHNQE